MPGSLKVSYGDPLRCCNVELDATTLDELHVYLSCVTRSVCETLAWKPQIPNPRMLPPIHGSDLDPDSLQ